MRHAVKVAFVSALTLDALVAGWGLVKAQQVGYGTVWGLVKAQQVGYGTVPGIGYTGGSIVPSGSLQGIRSGMVIVSDGVLAVSDGTERFTVASIPPLGAIAHQVVDRYFDASGQMIESRSSTHDVNYDCRGGLRRSNPLVAEDDGKGGTPRFVSLVMGNEPIAGVARPITAEERVKVILAASSKASPSSEPTPGPILVIDESTSLASAR